jgi:phosphatidylinositol alpha 1,6-mannosyltransferase
MKVAFFTDSFHEVNGVANTSRQFDAFARRRQLPFLRVNAGAETRVVRDGAHVAVELRRGPASLPVERDMKFDVSLPFRHYLRVKRAIREFGADVIHITGPSDIGLLGLSLAQGMGIPLVASWHTNLHEYSGRRLEKLLNALPAGIRGTLGNAAEAASLAIIVGLYRRARVGLAPNPELVSSLGQWTRKPCFLMRRGIDTHLFDPSKRDRKDGRFVIGYVGRITSEKGVRLLVDMERHIRQSGGGGEYVFRVIGHGGELDWLKSNLKQAEFPGVVKGEALAREYANMDLFVFPSRTDTFGNVVLEAFASGVPAVVTDACGPKFLVEDGVTGLVCGSDEEFAAGVARLVAAGPVPSMRAAARAYAMTHSWDSVFESVYDAYRYAMRAEGGLRGGLISSRDRQGVPRGPLGHPIR